MCHSKIFQGIKKIPSQISNFQRRACQGDVKWAPKMSKNLFTIIFNLGFEQLFTLT